MYRKYLFQASRRFNVSVLSYVVASNHTHVLIATGDRGRPEVSEALQYVHGELAQHYNLAKRREGAFWANRFHATWVQGGVHLRRCLFYIDMNMVRVGVVDRPAKWRHSSAHELAGSRQRYRIVDRERLLERLELPDWDAYTDWYEQSLADILARKLFRETQAFWSQSVAVGDSEWLSQAAGKSGMKRYDVLTTGMTWPGGAKSVFPRAQNAANLT